MAKHQFQAEINQLLHLMIHSLYSNKDIFLRELISNSSDAIDKLQLLTLTDDKYKQIAFSPKVEISFDKDAKTVTIADNGIGMNEEDLITNLGTIAKSGTKSFLEKLSGDVKKDSNLIGQFGVGFYASFMVADKVTVVSKKAGEDEAYKWISEAGGEYDIEKAERDSFGTSITLHLKDDADEYLSQYKLESIIKKYSDHIGFPIMLLKEKTEKDAEPVKEFEQINKASALWRRSKNEIKPEEYEEFYASISHDSNKPILHVHTKAEGTHEYTTLFYVPAKAPFDLFRVDYQPGVKLYVKKVFITDDDKELMPSYMRFVKGIIDAEDLPLNVSREILQQNRLLSTIKQSSTKKILGELDKLAKADKEKYDEFYKEFGRCLKEGLYQDYANKEAILDLLRFKSLTSEGTISLADYASKMVADQKSIYYIVGQNAELLKNSPLLEPFKAKNIDVLVLDDEIDEIVMPSAGKYKDFDIKSVVDGINDDLVKGEVDEQSVEKFKNLCEKIKVALGDEVKEVRVSSRLNSSPVCVVFDEGEMSPQIVQMMKAMGQPMPEVKPTLEINPKSELINKLEANEAKIADVAHLLYEQARLLGGLEIKNAAKFAKGIENFIANGL